MPPNVRAAYEESVRRGRIRDPYARGRVDARGVGQIGAAATTFTEAVPLADEAGAAMAVVGDFISGNDRNPGRAWGRARSYQDGQRDELRARNRPASDLATGAGYAVQAVPAFASGGATMAPQAASATARPVLRRAAQGAATVGRNAAVGGAYAAANAAAGRGDVETRIKNAAAATGPGMIAGAAVPVALTAAGAGSRAVGSAASGAVRTVTRAANRVSGGRLLNAEREATQRLVAALRKDGLSPQQIRAAAAEWQRVGGPSPVFMDIVNAGGRGQNTMALIRASASTGPGRNVAVQHQNQVAGNIQDTAINRTRDLTPERRPANVVADELQDTQRRLATEQYREPYQQPVTMTPEAVRALRGPDGQRAIDDAMENARVNQDYDLMAELLRLRTADLDQLPTVSAGAIDQVRIAFNEGGRAATTGNRANFGRGMFARGRGLDTALDATEGLAPARATFRNLQGQREGIDVGAGIRNADPDVYAADVARRVEMGPSGATLPDGSPVGLGGAQQAVGVGARQDLTTAIGAPAEGSTGALNRIATGTNVTRNLETTYGAQPTADYQQSLGNLIEQVGNARYINPNTGSQTAGRLFDEQMVTTPYPSPYGIVTNLLRRIQQGATLTEAEAEIITRIATGRLGEDLQAQIIQGLPRNAALAGPNTRPLALSVSASEGQRNQR